MRVFFYLTLLVLSFNAWAQDINTLGLRPWPEDSLWQGSRRSEIESLLHKMKEAGKHAALRDALVPVLTASSVAHPAGYGSVGAPFLVARAETLAYVGAVQEAKELLALLPIAQRRIEHHRLLAALLLVEAKYQAACPLVDEGLKQQPDPELQAYRALCALQEKNNAKADLALTVLDEQTNLYNDFLLVARACVHQASMHQGITVHADVPIALLLRDCPLAGVSVVTDDTTPPMVLSLLTGNLALSPLSRVRAAEYGVLHGVVTAQTLARLWAEYSDFTEEQRATPLLSLATLDRPAANALLWQAFAASANLNQKAALLPVVLEANARNGFGRMVALVYAPTLSVLPLPEDVVGKRTLVKLEAMGNNAHHVLQKDDETLIYAWGVRQFFRTDTKAWDRRIYNDWQGRYGSKVPALAGYLEARGYNLSLAGRGFASAQSIKKTPPSMGGKILQALVTLEGALHGQASLADTDIALATLADHGLTAEAGQIALELALRQGL
ncbi:MAG: hypothetical protein ACK5O9_07630 [Holosporales bacterium]|jgi:hypothetical protein